MHHSRRQSMTVSNQLGKPRLSEQRLAADLQAFQQSGGAIERLGDTPLRREKSVVRWKLRQPLQLHRPPQPRPSKPATATGVLRLPCQ